MKVEVLSHTPNPELNIAHSAAICYDSEPKELDKAQKMIRSLIKSGHTATLEHSSVTFRISGISRVVSHELVRHRIGAAYCQRSQRYVNEADPQYVIPPEIAENTAAMKVFAAAMESAWDAYAKLQQFGLKNEIARYVLPNATQTEMCVTMDFRALRHFFQLRCSRRAQPEIRALAFKMLDEMVEIAPSCFEDLKDESNLQNT